MLRCFYHFLGRKRVLKLLACTVLPLKKKKNIRTFLVEKCGKSCACRSSVAGCVRPSVKESTGFGLQRAADNDGGDGDGDRNGHGVGNVSDDGGDGDGDDDGGANDDDGHASQLPKPEPFKKPKLSGKR